MPAFGSRVSSSSISAETPPPKSDHSSSLGSSPDKVADNSNSEDTEDHGGDCKAGVSVARQLYVKERQRPVEANAWISPLSLQFSQMRSNEHFRCGRHLDDAVRDICPVRCDAEEANRLLVEDLACEASSVAAMHSQTCNVWRLECPFPAMRVLKWRCKLRDGTTGRPKVDPHTHAELYDSEERWFSLDNRRLCSLQKVAVLLWPDRAFVAVMELPSVASQRSREIKKFRTLDCGHSIFIGSRREGENVTRWSWRAQVGLEAADEEKAEEPGVGHSLTQRRLYRGPSLPPARGAGANRPIREDCSGFLPRRSRADQRKAMDIQKESCDSQDEDTGAQFGMSFITFFTVFVTIWLAIRLWKQFFQG